MKIFIPQREEAKKYIADRIEEMEREEIFVNKLIRKRAEGGVKGGNPFVTVAFVY